MTRQYYRPQELPRQKVVQRERNQMNTASVVCAVLALIFTMGAASEYTTTVAAVACVLLALVFGVGAWLLSTRCGFRIRIERDR